MAQGSARGHGGRRVAFGAVLALGLLCAAVFVGAPPKEHSQYLLYAALLLTVAGGLALWFDYEEVQAGEAAEEPGESRNLQGILDNLQTLLRRVNLLHDLKFVIGERVHTQKEIDELIAKALQIHVDQTFHAQYEKRAQESLLVAQMTAIIKATRARLLAAITQAGRRSALHLLLAVTSGIAAVALMNEGAVSIQFSLNPLAIDLGEDASKLLAGMTLAVLAITLLALSQSKSDEARSLHHELSRFEADAFGLSAALGFGDEAMRKESLALILGASRRAGAAADGKMEQAKDDTSPLAAILRRAAPQNP